MNLLMLIPQNLWRILNIMCIYFYNFFYKTNARIDIISPLYINIFRLFSVNLFSFIYGSFVTINS